MDKDPDLIDDDENPEWTQADFAPARPFKEVFHEQYKAWKKMGHPPVVLVELGTDKEEGIRATGNGDKVRAAKLPRDAIAKGVM